MKIILKAESKQGCSTMDVDISVEGKAPDLCLKGTIFKAHEFLPVTGSGVAINIRSANKECAQFRISRRNSNPKEVLDKLLDLIEVENKKYVDAYPAVDFTVERTDGYC